MGVGARGVTVVERGPNCFEKGCHPEGLPVAAFVGFAAPLITQVTREPLFPGLPVGIIAQRLEGEERWLSAGPEQKVSKDGAGTKQELVDLEAAVKARLPKEIGDGKGATLDRLAGGGTPSPSGGRHVVDFERTHIEPEVLQMRQGLQHGRALGGHVPPSPAVTGPLRMEAA